MRQGGATGSQCETGAFWRWPLATMHDKNPVAGKRRRRGALTRGRGPCGMRRTPSGRTCTCVQCARALRKPHRTAARLGRRRLARVGSRAPDDTAADRRDEGHERGRERVVDLEPEVLARCRRVPGRVATCGGGIRRCVTTGHAARWRRGGQRAAGCPGACRAAAHAHLRSRACTS